MEAGKLRHRLVIEQRVAASPQRTATGARDYAWTTLATVWGSLEPLLGRRTGAVQATAYKSTLEARIRYRSGVTAGMRVSFGGVYYLINEVKNPEHRNVELRLMLEVLPANG